MAYYKPHIKLVRLQNFLFRPDKEGMTPTLIAAEQGHLEGEQNG